MKPILDVCCGGKMFYFNKHDPRVLFCDKRQIKTTLCDGREFEVAPDMVADFTQLPFKSNSFKVVVFDPPHLLRNTGKSKFDTIYGSLNAKAYSNKVGWQHTKYGELNAGWQDMLRLGFAECFRVLEPNGTLIFKWNETDVKLSEILALTDAKPVLGHKSGKRSNTHWILFVKGGAA
ncbi:MAG: class I SAM-dependent methyltransferase, partial [Prevotella sp.]|nr:class I SAM-dependent methyltransferase [Prevotella sp.]